ncbi:hypothetical protein G7Y89_g14869 [Cudoniella acicularis]|uniref:Uncharacterized protein n=1 Tax=Cudoniella acicularis TaxID=354080 RepID=A0A8H4QY70_9HELO|nr:hypothetical protein G7Y89_g14869 [Cudoniella acicularis]
MLHFGDDHVFWECEIRSMPEQYRRGLELCSSGLKTGLKTKYLSNGEENGIKTEDFGYSRDYKARAPLRNFVSYCQWLTTVEEYSNNHLRDIPGHRIEMAKIHMDVKGSRRQDLSSDEFEYEYFDRTDYTISIYERREDSKGRVRAKEEGAHEEAKVKAYIENPLAFRGYVPRQWQSTRRKPEDWPTGQGSAAALLLLHAAARCTLHAALHTAQGRKVIGSHFLGRDGRASSDPPLCWLAKGQAYGVRNEVHEQHLLGRLPLPGWPSQALENPSPPSAIIPNTALAIAFGVATTLTGFVGLILKCLELRRRNQRTETPSRDLELEDRQYHRHDHYHLIPQSTSFHNNNNINTTGESLSRGIESERGLEFGDIASIAQPRLWSAWAELIPRLEDV